MRQAFAQGLLLAYENALTQYAPGSPSEQVSLSKAIALDRLRSTLLK